MRSAAAAVLTLLAAPVVLTACSSSSGPPAAKDCSSLVGTLVAADANAQIAAACAATTISDGQFPCSVGGKSVGQIFYIKGAKGNYAGRTGGTWVKATATQAEKLGVLATLAGCDVS